LHKLQITRTWSDIVGMRDFEIQRTLDWFPVYR
jgi:hypothetical protein